MNSIKLNLKGTVESRSEASGQLSIPGDAILIARGRPRWLLVACPCGSGEEFPINLDPRAGKAWRMYQNHKGEISIFPSVWRDSGSFCHYVIWNSKIFVFGQSWDNDLDSLNIEEINKLTENVLRLLPQYGFIHFTQIADSLDAVPWDVLIICRRLVRLKRALEGQGKDQGNFRRA